jgi:hypothetical protein
MSVEPVDDLLVACVSFVGAQRRLIDALCESGPPADAVALAMAAELDQFAAAVRQVQRVLAPRQQADPGA